MSVAKAFLVGMLAYSLAGCLDGHDAGNAPPTATPAPDPSGLQTEPPSPSPTLGNAPGNATGLGAPRECVLLDDQQVKCWGDNDSGQLDGEEPT